MTRRRVPSSREVADYAESLHGCGTTKRRIIGARTMPGVLECCGLCGHVFNVVTCGSDPADFDALALFADRVTAHVALHGWPAHGDRAAVLRMIEALGEVA